MVRHSSGVLAALSDLGLWFDGERIPAAIIGGIGASLRGRPTDIDVSFGAIPFEQEVIQRAERLTFGKAIVPIATAAAG